MLALLLAFARGQRARKLGLILCCFRVRLSSAGYERPLWTTTITTQRHLLILPADTCFAQSATTIIYHASQSKQTNKHNVAPSASVVVVVVSVSVASVDRCCLFAASARSLEMASTKAHNQRQRHQDDLYGAERALAPRLELSWINQINFCEKQIASLPYMRSRVVVVVEPTRD